MPREAKVESPSATLATQSATASPATNRAQAGHQIQPSAASATRATQNEGRCHQAPRRRSEGAFPKLCVKDGEKWCVTKWCVKDGVVIMVCDKVV